MALLPRLLLGQFSPCLAMACLACLLPALPTRAQSLQQQLITDARDGELNDFDFASAALIASGVDLPCELDGWRKTYAERCSRIISDDPISHPSDCSLPAIHSALHQRVLIGAYHSSATDLRVALSRGDFNCLSAVALYLDLCHTANHNLEIWLLPGHVCLRPENQSLGIIEPGTKEWRADFTRELALQAGRRITPIQLLGKFYYNRGIQLLVQRRFAAGLAQLEVSLQLDPADADARENLAAGFNNWAVEHCRARHYQEAAALINQGLAVAPTFAPLIANERLVRAKMGR